MRRNIMHDLNKWKNKLVVVEGSDCTSKSSVANLLVDYLNKNGVNTIFTFQPGDSNWGPLAPVLRSLCKDKRWDLHPLANFFAFQLDRVEQTSKVVVPALNEGKTVVSDRWNYSTYAYQLYGKELVTRYNMPKEVLEWLLETAIVSRSPDYVFYFPEKINVNRKDDENDAFDKANEDFFMRVHNAYEELAKKNSNWIRVLPGYSAEDTMNKILHIMDEL